MRYRPRKAGGIHQDVELAGPGGDALGESLKAARILQQADVTLPQDEPKDVEKPKPVVQPPAPETRAPPKSDHIGQFSEAGSNTYNALVFGHLQKFKRYPSAARGASGVVMVQFVLNRAGDVIDSAVTRSSGNDVLDREALAIHRRASPFPGFPAAKPGAQDTYIAPVNFAR